ncbi:MAG TPA: NfeD family protein [Vicinamibacterales bacterium]|nr:NfeD family protein [Acidobacteriota bacterium]HOC18428.1 NfeD family protein [Vicinamibacterales bacterium]
MLGWLQVSQFTVFLALAAAGFTVLLISLVFGELFEHIGFDHDADHDLSHGGPGFFSTRVMSVFVTTFGGAGALATYYGLSPLPASLIGFLTGIVFASLIYAFARFLYGQQATSEVRAAELVGRHCRVVVAIPARGVGQVRCQVGEELVDKIARSSDGLAIPENTAVTISEVLGEMVVVKAASAEQG